MAAGAAQISASLLTVDADVVVPSKLFPKEEYAARTIRPKLQKLLPVFCIDRIT